MDVDFSQVNGKSFELRFPEIDLICFVSNWFVSILIFVFFLKIITWSIIFLEMPILRYFLGLCHQIKWNQVKTTEIDVIKTYKIKPNQIKPSIPHKTNKKLGSLDKFVMGKKLRTWR